MKKFKIHFGKYYYVNIQIFKTRKALQKVDKKRKKVFKGLYRKALHEIYGKINGDMGNIYLSLEDMNLKVILHEALHLAIYYYTVRFNSAVKLPRRYYLTENEDKGEEIFVEVIIYIQEHFLKGLKKHGIKIKGL